MVQTSDHPNPGYSSVTKTYRSHRSPPHLPPMQHLSVSEYAFSIHRTTASIGAIINATTDQRLPYSNFIHHVQTLASSLQLIGLSKGDVAFIVSPPCIQIPVLYFSLLSIGVVVSPTNPISTSSELKHQIHLSKPVIAFATAAAKSKLPEFQFGTILIDSREFNAMWRENSRNRELKRVEIKQSDPAAILYSSGTTGRFKGVLLTHRNFISSLAGVFHGINETKIDSDVLPHTVLALTGPLFHVYGFFKVVINVALESSIVLMERFDFELMLKAVEKYRVTNMAASPLLVLAMVKSELVGKYDLGSLCAVECGGAPLGKEVIGRFLRRFPNVEIAEGYGLTEGGAVASMIGAGEFKKYGSVGRIRGSIEAKIVDPSTGEALPPGHRGELWLRGPTIMKGYIRDDNATAETLDPEGWLKTGDLCYFDSEGFLYIVDRLKELIKYKAYQNFYRLPLLSWNISFDPIQKLMMLPLYRTLMKRWGRFRWLL